MESAHAAWQTHVFMGEQGETAINEFHLLVMNFIFTSRAAREYIKARVGLDVRIYILNICLIRLQYLDKHHIALHLCVNMKTINIQQKISDIANLNVSAFCTVYMLQSS